MLRIRLLLGVLLFMAPAGALADWAVISDIQVVEAADQSVIRHEWTSTATDSTPYDVSACLGGVEARFDPSTGDASTDATMEIRFCRGSTDTWQRCRDAKFPGPNDGTTWVPINSTETEGYVLTNALTATAGGDTARVEVRCTGDLALAENAGGGALHPASGIDSELCLGENSDHGTDTVCLRIDSTTDIVSRDEAIGPSGQTGTRIMSAFVDDSAHGEVRELVRWYGGGTEVAPPTPNFYTTSGGTGVADTASFLNGGMVIGSTTGGAVRATGLSIRTAFSNAGNANRCDWQVQVVETTGYQFDSTDKADDAVTTACVGTIQMGASSSNSGGFGDTVVGAAFSGYYLPMSGDCACTTDDCFLAVSVSDRTPGSVTCDAINDVYVNLFVTETPL